MTAIERRMARRTLVLARRAERRAARKATGPTTHRVKVQTVDGARWVRVDGAVFAALHMPERGWIQGRKGNGVSVLSFGAASIDVATPERYGTAAIMAECPLGLPVHTPSWTVPVGVLKGVGDRRTGASVTFAVGRDAIEEARALESAGLPTLATIALGLDAAHLAHWQDVAGRKAKRAFDSLAWRRAMASKSSGRGRSEAARQDAPKLASARRQASFERQRAALTAAAIANGTLTND